MPTSTYRQLLSIPRTTVVVQHPVLIIRSRFFIPPGPVASSMFGVTAIPLLVPVAVDVDICQRPLMRLVAMLLIPVTLVDDVRTSYK